MRTILLALMLMGCSAETPSCWPTGLEAPFAFHGGAACGEGGDDDPLPLCGEDVYLDCDTPGTPVRDGSFAICDTTTGALLCDTPVCMPRCP